MKAVVRVLGFAGLACQAQAASDKESSSGSPINMIIQMITNLEQNTLEAGKAAQKEFEEYEDFCEKESRQLAHEIKLGKASVTELTATIEENKATINKLQTRTENLGADLASNDKELKKAKGIRDKEHADFSAEEKELMETIDMCNRAMHVLEKEMAGGASMLQMKHATTLTDALSVMVQASLINTAESNKLAAFVQASQGTAQQSADESSDDDSLEAPAAAAYESHKPEFIAMLEDVLDKAEDQLDKSRKKEVAARHEFEALKQSLEDESKYAQKDFDSGKKGLAQATEKLSTAQGELGPTTKELQSDTQTRAELHHDCMSRATAFEQETKSRAEEIKVLAKAKQIIKDSMAGASFTQAPSLVQLASMLTAKAKDSGDPKSIQVVKMIRDIGHKDQNAQLLQLADRISSRARNSGGSDPYAKIRGLVQGMITKLEDAAEADATKKEYCDKEMSETNAKKDDKSDEVQADVTKIEQASAQSAKLKEEVANLQKELSDLAKAQSEMDSMRSNEKATYDKVQPEGAKGLKGCQMAIKVLKDYYSKSDSMPGAANNIITLLEDSEAKMSAWLADVVSDEETAAAEYKQLTEQNELDKASKDKEVTYKTKEAKKIDKSLTSLKQNKDGNQQELDAVNEYLAKIMSECVAKPESYEERTKRREEEIAGLKEALNVLESESPSLVQKRSAHRRLLRAGAKGQGAIAA